MNPSPHESEPMAFLRRTFTLGVEPASYSVATVLRMRFSLKQDERGDRDAVKSGKIKG